MSSWRDDWRERLHVAWTAVRIARGVEYSLFTFGDSDLPYYVIEPGTGESPQVSVVRGNVRVRRPLIITPDNAGPELENFFADDEETSAVRFLMSRSAAFSNLKIQNSHGPAKIVTDSIEEAVDRLNRELDGVEEDRTAILVAPPGLASIAVLRYTTERILSSAPDNLQELRERGFLPGT